MPCEHVKCDGHQVLPKAVIKGPLKRLDLQFSETFIREVLTWNPATRQKNLSTQKKKIQEYQILIIWLYYICNITYVCEKEH